MKRLFFTVAIALIALASCQKAETTIEFNLSDIPEGATLNIYRNEGNGGSLVYGDTINDGTFRYTYKCDSIFETTSYSIILSNGNILSSRHLYVKTNCKSTISGTGNYVEKWTFESKNPRQQFDNKMNEATKDILIEINEVGAERYKPDLTQEDRRVISIKMDSLYTQYYNISLSALETMQVDEYWLEAFAGQTSTINYEGTDYPTYPKLTELYKKLSDADKATPVGKRITMDLFGTAPAVGDKITDYDLYDADGNIHHLAEFQGKWLIIDFSTYFCGPCRMFAPTIKYFYERGFNDKIEIVTVTLDAKSQFEEMVATEKYISPLWNDRDGRNGIFSLYKISAYPTFYVVKPDGTIADYWFGLDMGKILKTVKDNDVFPTASYQTGNGTTTITNPYFTDLNGGLLIDKATINNNSVVLDCTYPMGGAYSINSETGLYIKGKKVSKITNSSIGFDTFAQIPFGEIGHCTLTFEPLPQGSTEFDFVEGDCDGCFRVMGIKIKE